LHALNYYFSWGNLLKDTHLKKLIRETNFNGYILLTDIIGEPGPGLSWIKKPWGEMLKNQATFEDVRYLEQYAESWELNDHKLMIREKTSEVKSEIKLLGFG
jgi:hypothetical protein